MSYLATLKRTDDGGYEDASGLYHESAIDALCHRLGFCMCGRPEVALRFVRDVLRLISEPRGEDFESWYPGHVEREKALLGDSGRMYFVYYMLDHKELLEHGGCVPGWLSPDGQAILEDLEAIDLEDSDCN